MRKLVFKKVEFWVVGLILTMMIPVLVVFGMMVRNHAQGHDRFGLAGDIALNIASVPATIRQMWDERTPLLAKE